MPSPTPKPLISVILPVYNVKDHVAACIRSLQAQDLCDFEALVIDDGSTDNSADVARKAIAQDPRFRLVQQSNKGLSGARNTGLDLAQADYIAFLDSDDQLAPDYLSQLWQALEDTGADWVSCGIRFCFPDGSHSDHSAIHGQAARHSSGQRRTYPLTTWQQAIVHFPSAWNKLYRRSLIADLRFREGTWFEDHEFYYQAAARSDHLLHIEAPLYLQTRAREGQITGSDSDRVFEQFPVLDRIKALMATAPRADADAAFEQIASRLLFERSTALRAPERRARYADACIRYLDRHGLRYCPDWDQHISAAWGLEMTGTLPLSVVLPWSGGDTDLLKISLNALAQQGAPGREILILCNSQQAETQASLLAADHPEARVLRHAEAGIAAACAAGLSAARGRYINFLVPGDALGEMALHDWVDGMLTAEADFAVSAYRLGLEGETYHAAIYCDDAQILQPLAAADFTYSPELALALDGQISPKLYRRSFLIEAGLGFGIGALPGWQLALEAALLAPKALYFSQSGCDVNQSDAALAQYAPGRAAAAFVRSLDQLTARLQAAGLSSKLPQGWQRRLFARALRQRMAQIRAPLPRLKLGLLCLTAVWAALRRGLTRTQSPLDPGEGQRIATLLSIEAQLRRRP